MTESVGCFSGSGLFWSRPLQPPGREQIRWCVALLQRAVALVPVAGSRPTARGSGLNSWPHGSVRVPPIRVLLVVFIRQHRLKRATMQVEVKHIRSGKRRGGKRADKQFVDDPVSFDADCRRRGGGPMRRHHHTHFGSGWRQGNGRTIVERSCHPTFRMRAHLSSGGCASACLTASTSRRW